MSTQCVFQAHTYVHAHTHTHTQTQSGQEQRSKRDNKSCGSAHACEIHFGMCQKEHFILI
jgi:hypothetical protein